MAFFWRLLIVGLVLIGHFSYFIYWFNRVNATGLNRKLIKKLEKLVILGAFLLPLLVLLFDDGWLRVWLLEGEARSWPSLSGFGIPAAACFGAYSLAALLGLAPGWLWARPTLQVDKRRTRRLDSIREDLKQGIGRHIFVEPWVGKVGSIPGNQLHLLESNLDSVVIKRLPKSLDGLRIGHVSDLHLTGYMHREFYRAALSSLMARSPDIVVLSGDLIDFDDCLPQVQPLLESVKAPLGQYYVLGNHDRRIIQVDRLRRLLTEIGWHDLGLKSATVEKHGEEICLLGNERPWFDHIERNEDELRLAEVRRLASLRIGVAHSPDQWKWGRDLDLDLLFCGHTHGGQVRFPGIGPVIAPSWNGSRYASGWFDKRPMMMHVSRGLSGTHPFRFNCTPEVTVCVLSPKMAS